MKYRFGQTPEVLEELRHKTIEDCKILYGSDYSVGSCCWECGCGWNQILSDLSYEIEALNILIEKYGLAIVADQVKEKFNGLRFYYSIESKPKHSVYQWFLNKVYGLLKKIDFNVVYDFSADGQLAEGPSRFKCLYKLYTFVNRKLYNLNDSSKATQKQRIISKFICNIVDSLIDKAEDECENTCICCGRTLLKEEINSNKIICTKCKQS